MGGGGVVGVCVERHEAAAFWEVTWEHIIKKMLYWNCISTNQGRSDVLFNCIYFFLNLLTWDWVSRSQLHHTTITDHLFISSWADAALGVEVMRLVYRVSWWTVRRSAADSRTLTASALSCFEAHRKKYPWMQRLNRETVSAVNHAWYRKGRLSGRIWWNLMATSVSLYFFFPPPLNEPKEKYSRSIRLQFWKSCTKDVLENLC